MSISPPTKGSPLGCVVGTISLLLLIGSGIGGVLLWKILQLPETERPPEALRIAIVTFIGCSVVSIATGSLAIRILRTTDWRSYDPENHHGAHY